MFEIEKQQEYLTRVHLVFEYIADNLSADLPLGKLSKVALFSPFHFHRIFKFITGETVNEYVARQRIERAASDLLHSTKSITTISTAYGYSEVSSFSRSFKKFYGVSPSVFRKQNPNKHSKIRQLNSKNGQEYPDKKKYLCIIEELKKWIKMNAKIEVKDVPEMEVASVMHVGVQGLEGAFDKVLRWAAPKGLLQNPKAKMGRLFYDSFKITSPDKVRMRIFLKTDEPFEVEGEITKMTIEQCRCIVGRYEITPHEFEKSWVSMFLWMNENGYKKSEAHGFEIYHNDYREHPENKFIVDLCIPVK